MAIEHFIWTGHAELRCRQRHLDPAEVEQAIRTRHSEREVNDGRAEWLVSGETADGTHFESIYDHPHQGQENSVRIVSVWRIGS